MELEASMMSPKERATNLPGNVQPLPLLLSPEEFARELRVSVRSLRRLVAAGRVPAPCRVGRSLRWRRSEVERWVSDGCPRTY